MDARVERAIATARTHCRTGRGVTRRIIVPIAAAAALLVSAGAGSVLLRPFEGWSGPDYDVAWSRGVPINRAVVVDGYEVTLARAYADAGQLMLAIEVEDLDLREGTTQLAARGPHLVDSGGVLYPEAGGTGGPVTPHQSAELWYFGAPTVPLDGAKRSFTLTVPAVEVRTGPPEDATNPPDGAVDAGRTQVVPGPWQIDFELEAAGGQYIEPDMAAATVGGVTIAVESLLVTPTRLEVGLRLAGLADPDAWDPLGVVAQRGLDRMELAGRQDTTPDRRLLSAPRGIDDAGGEWTVSIEELLTLDGDRRTGPWTIRVTVPDERHR